VAHGVILEQRKQTVMLKLSGLIYQWEVIIFRKLIQVTAIY